VLGDFDDGYGGHRGSQARIASINGKNVGKEIRMDRLMEWVLTSLDFLMDIILMGEWSHKRGDVTPNIKIRRMQ
jgi:hypothetical protein